jgi:hypothetical protein
MNDASLELCKELFELSGWKDTEKKQGFYVRSLDSGLGEIAEHGRIPAYDLGYLLRKLPDGVALRHVKPANDSQSYWAAEYVPHDFFGETANTPEDATAKLAIELFKQGILTKEQANV